MIYKHAALLDAGEKVGACNARILLRPLAAKGAAETINNSEVE